MPYLLDTDFIIDLLRGRVHAVSTLNRLASERVGVSMISVGEIYEGAFRSVNPQAHIASFREFLRPFRTFTLNDPIMEEFARIRSGLRRRPELVPDLDILIGATAIHHELTLLTYNVRHLDRIDGLKVYQPN